MKKILKYLKPTEWLMIGVSLIFIVAQVWLELKLPGYMSEITTLVQTPGSEIAKIWQVGVYMLLSALGSLVSAIFVGYFAARIGASFSKRLRTLLFNKVESFSMAEISRFSIPSLITRSTNDVTQIQVFTILSLQVVIKAPIMAAWALTKIAGKGFEWSMVTGIAVAIVLTMVSLLMIFVIPKFKIMQTLTDNVTRVARENLTGLRVVRAYNAEEYQENKFETTNQDLTDVQMFTSRSMAVMRPMMGTIMTSISLVIYWIGAYLIAEAANMEKLGIFSDMVVFSNYAMQVIMSFMMLIMIFILLPRASVSADRINEVLDTKLTILDGKGTEGLPEKAGEISFENVHFRYPGGEDCVLQNINFTAKRGETVAFIGSTGSGKTTLINLIPRFYDATEGVVKVNGVDVKEYRLEELLNQIGYVPQSAVLFQGTVASNIAYGENGDGPYTPEDVKKAIAIAQAQDFVEEMDGQYDATIAQGGTNVSGGQKQRLSIARAVCRKPDFFIFDDSFSALDYQTDRNLRRELKNETEGVTTLIVAQRIGTIMDADQIIVLNEGKIVGKGTHEELLNTCKVYQEIAMSQLSEEELAL